MGSSFTSPVTPLISGSWFYELFHMKRRRLWTGLNLEALLGYKEIGKPGGCHSPSLELEDHYGGGICVQIKICSLFLQGQEVPVINSTEKLGRAWKSSTFEAHRLGPGLLRIGKFSPPPPPSIHTSTLTRSDKHVRANTLHTGSFILAKSHVFLFLTDEGPRGCHI